MLYSGEQFDPNLQMQYLRARYYDQDNGTFNRLDPFAGNKYDPQSLHKYAYAHCEPVMGIDPSGLRTLVQLLVTVGIRAVLGAIIGSVVGGVIGGMDSVLENKSFWEGFETGAKWGAAFGAIAGALPFTLGVKLFFMGLTVVMGSIGVINSWKSGNYWQALFRFMVAAIALGLLARAPTTSSSTAASTARSLTKAGLSAEQAEALTLGKAVIFETPSKGGDPTICMAQLVQGKLRIGIIDIKNTSGGGLKAFGTFRSTAYDIARAVGADKVELFGAAIVNNKISAILGRLGFTSKTVPVAQELGGGTVDVSAKTFSVPKQ